MWKMRSHLHAGHAGHRPGGESHFRLYIVSEAFRGKSRIERHRMINAALSSELKERVHALAIHAQAPGENRVARIAPHAIQERSIRLNTDRSAL